MFIYSAVENVGLIGFVICRLTAIMVKSLMGTGPLVAPTKTSGIVPFSLTTQPLPHELKASSQHWSSILPSKKQACFEVLATTP
jgi:hypothetical protein